MWVGFFAIFAWFGTMSFVDSGTTAAAQAASYVLGTFVITIAILLCIAQLRQRVVLDGEYMKVCKGLRTMKISRDEIAHASFAEDSHAVGGYRVAFPMLEKSDGSVEELSFLTHRARGEGAARVDGYVGEINDWLAK